MRFLSSVFAVLTSAALAGGIAAPAAATPVSWDVDYFQTSGTVTVTGSFVYDADLDVYSDVALIGTAASPSLTFFTNVTFSVGVSVVPGNTATFFETALADQTGQAFVTLTTPSLTNAGGTIANASVWQFGFFAGICGDATCSIGGQFTVPGETTASRLIGTPVPAVPVPAALPLLLAALGGLGILARRARRA